MPEVPRSSKPPLQAVRVWDLPTRLFHWVLAATIVASVVTAKIGGNAMEWHFRLGFVVLGLLVFRLIWGFVGGRYSRFFSFIYSPSTVLRYLRGQTRADEHLDVGHNPLGSFSVFAVLGVLAVQVATGLVADDEIASVGPLNKFVSSAQASLATGWHKDWGQWIIIALVALHIGAILFYVFVKKKRLVRAMLGGDKTLPANTPASADNLRTRLAALVVLAISLGVVAMVWRAGA
jgi:cytochrome b